MIWNEYIECSSRDAIIERQNKGLRKMVERLYFNVPFYRKKFQEMELSPYDIKGIEDLHKLPLPTNKICATTILWDCSPYRNRKLCACTLRAAQLANRPL